MKRLLATAAMVASLTVGAASAAPVPLDDSPTSQARQIVNVVFANYLKDRIGVTVQTAVADLDSDGTGEIIARFVHTGSCSQKMERCRTVVLRYAQQAWGIILDRHADGVEILEQGTYGPARLKVDDITWEWLSPSYAPTAESMGDALEFTSVPLDKAASLSVAFGPGAQKLVEARQQGVSFSFARPAIAKDAEVILVKMDGPLACGSYTGCPLRLLKKEGESWTPILATHSRGNVSLSKTERQGYRDLVVTTDRGFAVLGWNGSGYLLADRIEALKAE